MTIAPDAVAVVRAFTTALGAGDVSTCLGLLAEDIVFAEAASLPFGGEWVGKSGFVALLKAVGRDYDVRLEPPTVDAAGDAVLVRVFGTFTSRRTGRSMPMKVLDLYRLRDGLVVRVDVYYQDSLALRELGGHPSHGAAEAATR
ncbi:nuclear transport factor 2 family protein [Frankia gtarii]|uniref:nuclear transport factor 2 family protein n=1 Tax=Frankia gtarii TaxID=2950102 RepID=UPI0021C21B33|nr:nuclear transport factor 2 family protein [Frankia gtarii]